VIDLNLYISVMDLSRSSKRATNDTVAMAPLVPEADRPYESSAQKTSCRVSQAGSREEIPRSWSGSDSTKPASRSKRWACRSNPITKAIAERAASLRASRQMLRLPDALVLACGDVLDANTIVTVDRRWRRSDRLRVIS